MSQPMRKPKQLSSQCLPYDVVFDILTRLPVKSIIRFSFVSKSWNSILTSPDFINTHLDRAKSSLSHNNNNNNGFLLYIHKSYYKHLCTVLCNSDHTFTEISKLKIPFSDISVVDFCNGMFCLKNFENHELYLWNPSIRKFKILTPHYFARLVAYGLGFHSQNKDFKILRILCDNKMSEAEIYTLSTDSWRRVVISMESEPNIGSINLIDTSPCLFFKGALHSIAFSWNHRFILSFDVNAETFRQIMVPRNYFNENISLNFESLVVFKGSLAVFVCVEDLDGDGDICYLWVMREYGVVESWTKISVPINFVQKLFGCTDNGELLINTTNRGLVSYDPESLNENYLGIQSSPWLSYTAGLIESLVLLDQVKCHLNMKISLNLIAK
jgi:F-box interacting protein